MQYLYDNTVTCEFVHAGSAPRAKRRGLDPYPFLLDGDVSPLHVPCSMGEAAYLPQQGDASELRKTFLCARTCELAVPGGGAVSSDIPSPGQVGVGGSAYLPDEGVVRMVQTGVLTRLEEKSLDRDREKKVGPFYWGAVLCASQIVWFRDPEVPALLAHTTGTSATPDEITNLAAACAVLDPSEPPDRFILHEGRRSLLLSTGMRDPDRDRTLRWVRLINFAAAYRWAGVRRVDQFLESQQRVMRTLLLARDGPSASAGDGAGRGGAGTPPTQETYAQVNTYAADLVARSTLARDAYARARAAHGSQARAYALLRPCTPLSRAGRERLSTVLAARADALRAAHLVLVTAHGRLHTLTTDTDAAHHAGIWGWLTDYAASAPPGTRRAPQPLPIDSIQSHDNDQDGHHRRLEY